MSISPQIVKGTPTNRCTSVSTNPVSLMKSWIFPCNIQGDSIHKLPGNDVRSIPRNGSTWGCSRCSHIRASRQRAFAITVSLPEKARASSLNGKHVLLRFLLADQMIGIMSSVVASQQLCHRYICPGICRQMHLHSNYAYPLSEHPLRRWIPATGPSAGPT